MIIRFAPGLNVHDIVRAKANEWRSLRAWRAILNVDLKIIQANGKGHLGWAYCEQRKATIKVTGVLAIDLATSLHELAHLAAPSYVHHELPWRELYIAAVSEVVGDDIYIDDEVTKSDFEAQTTVIIDRWLTTSGQRAFFNGLGLKV